MEFWSFLSGHRYELLAEMLVILISSAVGFLSGSLIKSAVDKRDERKAFHSMLSCIRAEADNNLEVLETGLKPNSKEGGIVLQRFSTAVSRQHLGVTGFMRLASHGHVATLGRYIRLLELSNAYADSVRMLEWGIGRGNGQRSDWLERIQAVWQPNIVRCEESIKEISALFAVESRN